MSQDQSARANLIERVRKAMALASDPNAHEDERDAAARMVDKLIAKYEIADAELRRKEGKGAQAAQIITFTVPVSNAFKLGKVRCSALAWAAVEPFGGTTLRTYFDSAREATILRVFIREDLAEVSRMLIESLLLQLSVSETKAAKDHIFWWKRDFRRNNWVEANSNETQTETGSFRRSYIVGWGRKINARVRLSRKEALEEARREAMADAYAHGTDGAELAKVGAELALPDDTQRVIAWRDAWFEKKYGTKLRSGRASKSKLNEDGYASGSQDGSRADIGLTQIGRERAGIGRGQRALG